MKLLNIIIIGLIFISCKGSSDGDSSDSSATEATIEKLSCGMDKRAVGTWENASNGSDLVYNSDCTYTSHHCGGAGKIIYATSSKGVEYVYVIIKETNGATGCLPKGTFLCAYRLSSETTLTFTCDGKNVTIYTKK